MKGKNKRKGVNMEIKKYNLDKYIAIFLLWVVCLIPTEICFIIYLVCDPVGMFQNFVSLALFLLLFGGIQMTLIGWAGLGTKGILEIYADEKGSNNYGT